MIYKVKALVRWLRYSLRVGVSYHAYDNAQVESANFEHPRGWYEARGKTIAFRGSDGGVQFLW